MAQPYDRIYNFSAGPSALPVEVLEQVRDDLLNWQSSGMSVMEMSHRSDEYMGIIESAEADLRSFLGVPNEYKVIFFQGGASTQFSLIPMNLLTGSKKADYIVTGSWGQKAVAAAKFAGDVNVIYDAKESNFNHAPNLNDLNISSDADYVHMTLNETIQGVDYMYDPSIDRPLVCDMSSNIGSRKMDFSKYDLIYAGAQKNLGPAGLAVVIISPEALERSSTNLPTMFSFKEMEENKSLFNTPPTFAIYVLGLVCKHWNANGGLEAVESRNESKANKLYAAIDGSNGYYTGHALVENRSRMNIPFNLPADDLVKKFLQEGEANGLCTLAGHRSVGGCRASIYNAFPEEGVDALVDFMKSFADSNPA